jgi:ATP-binding cassette subfamily F protein 3
MDVVMGMWYLLEYKSLKYSLIGRNGIGKSTLLRNLALREVAIPTHITVLYVEQEIVGDDTTALDSVLQADVWRHKLITEEKELMARLDELEKTSATPQDGAVAADEGAEAEKDDITERLGDIQKKLVDMEAETGPSRASALLAGLGFDDADQKPTRAFSGGWRMRLALARALFVKPDVSYEAGD